MINLHLDVRCKSKYICFGFIGCAYLASIPYLYADVIADTTVLLGKQVKVSKYIEAKKMCKEQNARCQGATFTNIDIISPDKNGLSHNKYKKFNNERGQGYNKITFNNVLADSKELTGNPFLIDKTAKVILNEVTSKEPSQLHGSLVVAGDKAHVIIANPSGISCDGCSFSNTEHVTLTTGIPVVHAGTLIGYDVNRGTIHIKKGGLDHHEHFYTFLDFFANSLKIDGEVISDDIVSIIGQHAVSFAPVGEKINIRTMGGFTSDYKKKVNVDVSKLGGMYADRIFITTRGGSVSNKGIIDAEAVVNISSSASVKNNGGKITSQKVILRGLASIDNMGGRIKAERQALPYDANNRFSIRMSGGDILNRNGSIYANSGHILIQASELVENVHGTIKSNMTSGAANIKIKSKGMNNSMGGIITSSDIDIDTGHLKNYRGKIVSFMGKVDLSYWKITENLGEIHGGIDVHRTVKP
ncbi:two-partner secretion domain-containing protein [Yersinia aleksiciae]|uniref:Heme utilization protein n=1 Tax=Yersinia aleksiciae TaxID=263819 RepID=A0A0T9UNJ7_YERAE|nr:filamentous hemagglutinin N-terminal domain-containing protein [Yersinia aleksiciae]AKP33743.1 heme utilization protein [Yersinia aleksiciae]CFQ46826.1 Large exoprotein involved in heme utilization or adhesion [Yersinia aleksiciae]CNL56327.1 Large exoprotein involved in heme utilization or adhesion [Yersinia aleksiciae]